MKITFIDTGLLFAAFRGEDKVRNRAFAILDDPQREFASSEFVRLEVLPKAVYHQNQLEVEFYETFFKRVKHWADISEALVKEAYKEACQSGLSAVEALHVVAAVSVNADVLVTTERPEKPIHRTTVIKVVSIQ